MNIIHDTDKMRKFLIFFSFFSRSAPVRKRGVLKRGQNSQHESLACDLIFWEFRQCKWTNFKFPRTIILSSQIWQKLEGAANQNIEKNFMWKKYFSPKNKFQQMREIKSRKILFKDKLSDEEEKVYFLFHISKGCSLIEGIRERE